MARPQRKFAPGTPPGPPTPRPRHKRRSRLRPGQTPLDVFSEATRPTPGELAADLQLLLQLGLLTVIEDEEGELRLVPAELDEPEP